MERKQYVSTDAVVDVIEQAAERDGYRKEYIQIKADDLIERIKNIHDFFYIVDDPMTSSDYKARFKAEYYQTKIRYLSLFDTIVKYEAGTLSFVPNSPIEILKAQSEHMLKYLFDLAVRAELEGIAL